MTESDQGGGEASEGSWRGADARLSGGDLNAAVTSALVGIYAELAGRGPERASTFYHGNVLVTIMRGVHTPAGRALTARGDAQLLGEVRRRLREVMEPEFRRTVETLTGLRVLTFIGGDSIERDASAYVFILDGQP